MNIDELRYKHKTTIIDHAIRIYEIGADQRHDKQQWVNQLLSGVNLQHILDALKSKQRWPESATSSMSEQNRVGSLTLINGNLVFQAGEIQSIRVIVENSSNTTWQTSEATPIYISYHWYFENGEVYHFDGRRTELSRPIPPSETQNLTIHVQPPEAPGKYLLEITMVMEGRFWFEEKGLSVFRVPTRVTDLPVLSPRASKIHETLYRRLNRYISENIL